MHNVVQNPAQDGVPAGARARCQKLLQQEVSACDDPICCCEAEPRWIRLQNELGQPSEWESLERSSSDEL